MMNQLSPSNHPDSFNLNVSVMEQRLRELEIALEQSETRYQQIFEDNRAIKLIIDPHTGDIVGANSAAVEFYGYTHAQLLSMRIQQINTLPPDEVAMEIQRAVSQNRSYFEFRHRLANGEIRVVDVFSSPFDTPDGKRLYSIVVDVTTKRSDELRYRALFEQSNDAVFILDMNSHHVDVNQRACELTGYTRDELLRMSAKDLVIQDEYSDSANVLQRLLEGEQVPPYERRFRRKDGQMLIAEINVEMVRNHDHSPLYIQSIVRDITARKQMELANRGFLEDMKALQALYLELSAFRSLDVLCRRMVEMAHGQLGFERVGLFLLDEDGHTIRGMFGTDTNGELRDERYYSEAITDDHWIYDISNAPNHTIAWYDAELFDNGRIVGAGWKIGAALWNGQRAIGCIICDNFITQRPARPYESELISLLGSTLGHLIERQRAEAALRDSEERYRSMFDSLSEGIMLHNQDGTIQASNPAAEKILGLTVAQMRGVSSIDPRWRTIHEDGRAFPGEEHPSMVTLAMGKPMRGVIMGVYKPDDSLTWISINSQPLFGDNTHTPAGVLVSFTDITELRESQQRQFDLALEKARLSFLSEFIQNAAHEFRTPLSIISSATYLMSRSTESERLYARAEQVQLQIERISRLVDSLLGMVHYASIQTLPMQLCNLRMSIESICASAQQRYGENPVLHFSAPHTLPLIPVNEDALAEALEQLLDNAYRFTPRTGKINVTILAKDEKIVIEVQDSGVGISEQDLPYIFDSFWRQDSAHSTPGFGLGLGIVQRIVTLQRWEMTVESEIGKGTRFQITLPYDSLE